LNTDNPRPWKKDVTKGEWKWKVNKGTEDCGSFESSGGGQVVCWFGDSERFYPTSGISPARADRELILEASRVLHQTGMTPGELAERVGKLEGYLKTLLAYAKTSDDQDVMLSARFVRGWVQEALHKNEGN